MKISSKVAILGCATAFALGAVAPGVAGAAGPKGKTICTTITGNAASTVSISGCTDVGGANTGGGSQPLPVASLAVGGTVTWLSGKTSSFGAAVTTATNAKKCPGYVKFKKGTTAPPEHAALKFSGVVSTLASA